MMGKKLSIAIISIIVVIFIFCAFMMGATGIFDQTATRAFGGSMEIRLEPNVKLDEITWKDDASLWYLTRPMDEDEEAVTHTFQQKSEFGVFNGTVTIIESKTEFEKEN